MADLDHVRLGLGSAERFRWLVQAEVIEKKLTLVRIGPVPPSSLERLGGV